MALADTTTPIIPSTLNPRLYKSIESLCRTALAYSDNHSSVRTAIGELCFYLERESISINGQLTIDVFLLKRMLKRSHPKYEHERPTALKDPITELASGGRPLLNSDHERAAAKIREIWAGFQKFLTIASRSYDGKSGKKNRVIQPLDVISEELFSVYRSVYTPWFEKACRVHILDYKKERLPTSEADICIAIILENIYPHQYDTMRGLPKNSSIRALKTQLDQFNYYLGKN